ncbi:MAG: hypothetical protein ABS36_01080 [Acidobacteria bacterium SCN 69-37]|nr:MAG: hypothetical protein ABS36_01080 [Acidobacteria bacterium SCN 69-37]
MFIKAGSTNDGVSGHRLPRRDAPCQCLADFFRQELTKHYACLEAQREYYSDVAITQAEEAIARLMAQIEVLCQREDACQMIGELLRKFDSVTKLSAWTDPGQLH